MNKPVVVNTELAAVVAGFLRELKRGLAAEGDGQFAEDKATDLAAKFLDNWFELLKSGQVNTANILIAAMGK